MGFWIGARNCVLSISYRTCAQLSTPEQLFLIHKTNCIRVARFLSKYLGNCELYKINNFLWVFASIVKAKHNPYFFTQNHGRVLFFVGICLEITLISLIDETSFSILKSIHPNIHTYIQHGAKKKILTLHSRRGIAFSQICVQKAKENALQVINTKRKTERHWKNKCASRNSKEIE